MRWDVEFDNGVTARAEPEERPDADLWKLLFPSDTFVRPHAFVDHAKKNFHSFPVREILQFLESTYGSLSAAGPRPAVHRRHESIDAGLRSAGRAHERDRPVEIVLGRGRARGCRHPRQGAARRYGRPRQRVGLVLGSQRAVRGVPLLLPPGRPAPGVRPGLQTRLRRAVAGPAGLRLPRHRGSACGPSATAQDARAGGGPGGRARRPARAAGGERTGTRGPEGQPS